MVYSRVDCFSSLAEWEIRNTKYVVESCVAAFKNLINSRIGRVIKPVGFFFFLTLTSNQEEHYKNFYSKE